MRKNMTYVLGLGLALSLGAAGVATAQRGGQRTEQGDERGGRRGGPGGPERVLLKGITLSDAQKSRLEQLRADERKQFDGSRDEFRKAMEGARAARQKGDTASARAMMERLRSQMDRQREQRIATLRGLLTEDQRRTFDANAAELKQRQAQRGDRKDGKGGEGRGFRGRRAPGA